MELTIEHGKETVGRCGHCGKVSHTIRGFVSNETGPYAVYFAGYTEKHEDGIGTLIISLGNWGEGATPDDRRAVLLRVRGRKMEMMVGDADDSPWTDIEVLGRILSRDEALKNPRIKDYYHVADHIVAEDERFTRYFRAARR
jgi:hypothetical protein